MKQRATGHLLSRTMLASAVLLTVSGAGSQTLTAAAGSTEGASTTQHDAYRLEVNLPWKPELWASGGASLSLHHALSVMTFQDKNTVYAVSWAPDLILAPRVSSDFHPYAQIGLGLAFLSDDKFESETQPRYRYNGAIFYDEGTSDMGSHGQFESSVAIGLVKSHFGARAKYYHYSNAGISRENGGMDVAEFGVSYSF